MDIVREVNLPPQALQQLAARFPAHYPMLFDSAAPGPLGQQTILVTQPRAALWSDSNGKVASSGFKHVGEDFLTALENWWRAERSGPRGAAAPFAGGWVLFLGYETAQNIEPRLSLPRSPIPWNAFALRVGAALIQDPRTHRTLLTAEADNPAVLARIEADLRRLQAEPAAGAPFSVESVLEENPEAYLQRVARAQEYIRAGDIYQANLSRPWQLRLSGSPSIGELYARLRTANPAPFAALAQWNGVAILSSSPERLARIEGRRIDTRPIAGTRPRSRRFEHEAAEKLELAAHPKERAEHIMLIDLERNDLGRVCEAGTVRVDELMTIESYAHVHHIVSNVCGLLRPDITPIGALRALFPGGTITGCPKFRCMQIIAELEGTGRGAYTGSLGYLGTDGSMDMNILIRTLTVSGNRVDLRAGGGIVADSDPCRELEETRAKARGMLAAFEVPQDGPVAPFEPPADTRARR